MSNQTGNGRQPRCGAMASRADFGSSAAPCAMPGGHDGDHATADGRVRWARRQQTSAETGKREASAAETARRYLADPRNVQFGRDLVGQLLYEHDLAVAHDRQPYPTADAYDAACAALHAQRDRAEAAERALEEMRRRVERVRSHARNPRSSSGMTRDYVYARDVLALLGEREVGDGG